MDAFVTRTPVERRVVKSTPAAADKVQVRLTDMRRVVRVEAVTRVCDELKAAIGAAGASDDAELLRILRHLDTVYITFDTLRETGLGRLVYRLHKSGSPAVMELATALYVKWRADCQDEVKRSYRRKASAGRRSDKPLDAEHTRTHDEGVVDRSILLDVEPMDLEKEMGKWDHAAGAASHRKRRRNSTSMEQAVDDAEDRVSHDSGHRIAGANAILPTAASGVIPSSHESGVKASSLGSTLSRTPSGSFPPLALTRV